MEVLIDGLKIEYTEAGSGKPILLLHGWGSSKEVFAGVMQTLSDRYRLIAPDFPGCGASDTMKAPWTLENYCDFVLKFMDALGMVDPVLIGHSNGGRISMNLAAKGMVSPPKIVLLDAAGLIPKKEF